eukprot:SM000209S06383  [mRNA]  locus=s209:194250:197897:- [translate_table: standard]
MREQKFESYFGRKIAIDASMSIYQFLVRPALPAAAAASVAGPLSPPCTALRRRWPGGADRGGPHRHGAADQRGRRGHQVRPLATTPSVRRSDVHHRGAAVVIARALTGGRYCWPGRDPGAASHLQGMFTRTIRLLEAGMRPVYVFDGQPPDLKKEELKKRFSKREDATEGLAQAQEVGEKEAIEKYSKRTVRVTKQHNDDCRRLLTLMGVPVVQAPSEAEAECAWLCKTGKVYAVASEDMDSLTFGSTRFLRHLMDPAARKVPVMEFEISKVLEGLQLTMEQFVDMCILCGCDYCDTIRGIGPQSALKLIRQHGNLEAVLEHLNKDRYSIPEPWPYKQARELFSKPLVNTNDEDFEFKWYPPDEEGLRKFLVDENGFNNDRVVKAIEKIKAAKNKSAQGRLETFFRTPTPGSAPKRKDTEEKGGKGAAVKKGKPAGSAAKKTKQ